MAELVKEDCKEFTGMYQKIDVDINGSRYTVPKEMFKNGPSVRLTRIYNEEILKSKASCIFINRPKDGFLAMLAFYQTGELHIPTTSCPVAFLNELKFWEISPEVLRECCYNRVRSYLIDLHTLREFTEQQTESETSNQLYTCLKGFRTKVWDIVDYTKPTLVGRLYFALTFLMVMLSILVMAYSTDPNFQRLMSNCERLDYMYSSGLDDYHTIKPYLQEICNEVHIPSEIRNISANATLRMNKQANENDQQFLLFLLHELHVSNKSSPEKDAMDEKQFWLNVTQDFLPNDTSISDMNNKSENINRSSNGPLQQSFFYFKEAFVKTTKEIKVPNFKARIFVLIVLDGITTIFFTTDILIKLFTCPSLRRYFISVINCADILSLLGIFLYIVLYFIYPHLRYGSWIDKLAYIQVLRVMRFFRIVVNVRAGKVMWYSARKNIKNLSILALFLITGMTTCGSCFYVAEGSKAVKSVPDAWYWAIITMTTVGYGDIQPQTNIGRLISCICAVSGILLLALTVPVFANHFLLLYQYTETENIVMEYQSQINKSNAKTRKEDTKIKA